MQQKWEIEHRKTTTDFKSVVVLSADKGNSTFKITKSFIRLFKRRLPSKASSLGRPPQRAKSSVWRLFLLAFSLRLLYSEKKRAANFSNLSICYFNIGVCQ